MLDERREDDEEAQRMYYCASAMYKGLPLVERSYHHV